MNALLVLSLLKSAFIRSTGTSTNIVTSIDKDINQYCDIVHAHNIGFLNITVVDIARPCGVLMIGYVLRKTRIVLHEQ